jgi:hypothetical protein
MEGWVKRYGVVELRMMKYKINHCTHLLHSPAVLVPYTPSACSYFPVLPRVLVFAKFGGWERGSRLERFRAIRSLNEKCRELRTTEELVSHTEL